jgi:glycosyltransferase involved in cell wall biosynthesis
MVLPNFKNIDYVPTKELRKEPYTRFVFLSRIVEQKGCGYIVKATEKLNRKYKDKFIVDFYGSIGDDYRSFESEIKDFSNVNYKGFLDLRNTKNYDVLSSYDAMLFPTFWHGEGFPGIMIDAFISGLPVIATDWHMNKDILQEGVTGFFVRPNNVDDLVDAMEKVMLNPAVIEVMSKNCQKEATKYNTDNVVNAKLIKKIF